MSTPPSTLRDLEEALLIEAKAALRRQLDRMEELAAMGMRLARAVDAEAAEGKLSPVKAIAAVQRAGRGVRQCGLLETRLLNELRRMAASERISAQADRATVDAMTDPAYVHKARVERIVARVAAEEHRGDEEEAERLAAECAERLDDDIYGDVSVRPVGELVALICRDLGLDPDWERLSQEAWAQDELGVQGSPFAKFPPSRPPPSSAENGGGAPPAGERVVERDGRVMAAWFDSA